MVRFQGSAEVDAFLIGAATGGRTSAGLAGLALTSTPDTTASRPLRWFGSRWGKPVQLAAFAGEVVVDKLPSTPSRLKPGPLGTRTVTGSTAAAALARRDGTPVLAASALGAAGALVGSAVGASWRALVARRGRADFAPAVFEDVVSLALALYACRPKGAPHIIDLTIEPPVARRRDGDRLAAQPQVN